MDTEADPTRASGVSPTRAPPAHGLRAKFAWYYEQQIARMRRALSRMRMELDLERARRPLLYRHRRSYSN